MLFPRRHAIHTVKTPTIGLLSSRGQKHRSGRAPVSAKRRPAATGLSQDELLAKIDALDWDQTVSPNTVAADDAPVTATTDEPGSANAAWRLAAVLAGLACFAAVAYYVLVPAEPSARQQDIPPAKPIAASADQASEVQVMSQEEMKKSLAAVTATEDHRAARFEQAVRAAELDAQRKAERARRTREAQQAELAKVSAQKERERQEQEAAARLRARQEEEEARAAAVRAREQAEPKGPASPRDACAGEGNFLTRGLCEVRLCSKPEWRSHPQCVKRFDDQLRALNPGN